MKGATSMVSMKDVILAIERDEKQYIGTVDGSPWFIDVSGCPFAKDCVYRYNPLNENVTDISFVDTVKDVQVKALAEHAIRQRDKKNERYIADLHSMGEKTLTEERKEKAARESRTA